MIPHTLKINTDPKTGLIHLDPLPNKQSLEQYYEKYHQKLTEVYNPRREKQRLKVIRRFVSSGRLLDVGAGRGFFVKTAQKAGFTAEGIEISKHAVSYARKRFGLKLHQGDFLDLKLTSGVYDVITFHSTLEHFPQPLRVLKKALTLLKSGGLLVFSVPNLDSFEFYLSQHTPYPYTGFIQEHLFYFNHRIVNKLLKQFRLKPLLITSRHYSPIESLRLSPVLIGNLAKRVLEATDWGGRLGRGNVLYVYAQKTS